MINVKDHKQTVSKYKKIVQLEATCYTTKKQWYDGKYIY